MKKFFILIMALYCTAQSSFAQTSTTYEELENENQALKKELAEKDKQLSEETLKEKYRNIWGKGRYTNIGYAISETSTEYSKEKAKFGISVTKGSSFLFPNKPLGGMVKVGFDINWADLNFAKYDKATITTNIGGHDYREELTGLNRWNLLIGVFGIGPNVTVAPLSFLNNAANALKASIYFHYQPTFGMYLNSGGGESEAAYAYCNMFQFGGKITWKVIGVGIEGYWGSGKFKSLSFDEGFNISSSDSKITRKFANTRIYLSLMF